MGKNDCHQKNRNREKRPKHGFFTRMYEFDFHHLIPRSQGGESINSNLLKIDIYRHDAFHLLFKDRSIVQIISVLKKYNNINDYMKTIDNYYKWKAYKLLFGFKKIEEVIYLLERINRAKFNQKISFLKMARNLAA